MITFGEIPKEILNNYQKYGRCAALNKEIDGKIYKNRKWECEVSGIYFGDVYNETYVYKLKSSRASFFSFRKRALVPKEIFDFFEKNYFTELIQNKTCQRDIVGKYDNGDCFIDVLLYDLLNYCDNLKDLLEMFFEKDKWYKMREKYLHREEGKYNYNLYLKYCCLQK